VASSAANEPIMKQIWNPVVTPVKSKVQSALDGATTQVKAGVKQAVTAQVPQQQIASVLPSATAKALQTAATKAHASVVDGRLVVNYADASQRKHVVDEVAPSIIKELKAKSGSSDSSASATSDTSFLNGADPRLSKPFLSGFNASAVQIYWVGLIVLLIAFVLTWFFSVPPLRQRSALQEQADNASAEDELEVEAGDAAALAGSPVGPATGSVRVVGSRA
jgi:hypothetical protein